jgi:hypothetical protein
MKIKLSPEVTQQVDKQIRNLLDLLPQCDDMPDCGMDGEQYKHEIVKIKNQLEAIKKHYGSV